MKIKRGWQKKLDKLKARASRVVINLDTEADTDHEGDLAQQAREGRLRLDPDTLNNPAVVKARRRLRAVSQEHQLGEFVLGCYVTLTVSSAQGNTRFHLGISRADGSPPCPDEKPWGVPGKFDRIRRHLGAPESPSARGPRALHWHWPAR